MVRQRTSVAKVEVWSWVLIYAGLILLGLGLSIRRGDAALGLEVAALGSGLGLIGVLLIWVRSRMSSKVSKNS